MIVGYEKPTRRRLHECCGMIMTSPPCAIGNLSPHQINIHLLCAFCCGWRQCYNCYQCLSYKISWNERPNDRHKTPWLRRCCVYLIHPSKLNNYHSLTDGVINDLLLFCCLNYIIMSIFWHARYVQIFMCVCVTCNYHQIHFELDATAYIIGISVKNGDRECLLEGVWDR